MSNQTVPYFRTQGELTLGEAFGFVLRHYLAGMPSMKMDASNIRWWIQTTGAVPIHLLKKTHVTAHIAKRQAGEVGRCRASAQTIRHDVRVLVTMLGVMADWKNAQHAYDGFRFADLSLPLVSPAKGVKRPQATPRRHKVSPDTFSHYCEHASERMLNILYFLNDFGQSPSDIKRWGPKHYDASTDSIRFYRWKNRNKTRKEVVLPVSDRCRPIILEAIAKRKRRFIDWKEDDKEYDRELEHLRRVTGETFQPGRDLRKTLLDDTIKAANNDVGPAQRIGGHAKPTTTLEHYYIDDGKDLRPFIQAHSDKFSGVVTVTRPVPLNIFSMS
jgi:integrase